MELKRIITEIRNRRLKDSDDALQAIAESEKYLQQAYEGRYLFELIQNVRDANKEQNTLGSVFIDLTEATLTVRNTGAPFGEKGINSITTIGRSPKKSQNFIGFKGIGFKSVLEITHAPRIVTEQGTLYFDRSQTAPLLKGRSLVENEIPVFFIPHYSTERLSSAERDNGIVTKIVLSLKPDLDAQKIVDRFDEIGVHQVLLLGNLQTVDLRAPGKLIRFSIQGDTRSGQVVVQANDKFHHFRKFTPSMPLPIPADVITQLEDKERRMYEKSPFVELSLVFDTDDQRQLRKIPGGKLYLFYPLKIDSGFPFLLHSYFLVDPARTTLRDSPLNVFLLEQIADYLSGEWLKQAKKADRQTFLNFLAFERNKDVPVLDHLYDRLLDNLQSKRFLYDQLTNLFYTLAEIVIADGFDLGLFADHLFQGKRLIYVEDVQTRTWLVNEMKADYLTYDKIAEHIEAECEKHKNNKHLAFFQHLYQYATNHPELKLNDRKVLLTRNWELLSSEADVFYGMTQQLNVIFPASIQKHIHFIHPQIKIPEQRQGKNQTGYVEYSTELLVRRLLDLYEDESVPKIDILITLLQLKISEKLLPLIRQRVWLPVRGIISWVRPFNRAVYCPRPELQALYPAEKFVNLTELETFFTDKDWLAEKLLAIGAWDIPAIYYVDEPLTITSTDYRFLFLKGTTRWSAASFELSGDWQLDVPQQIDTWFTTIILQRHKDYLHVVNEEDNPRIKCKSPYSGYREMALPDALKCYGFIQFLRHKSWIRLTTDGPLLPVQEVIGMDPIEYIQAHSLPLRKFLDLLPIHYKSNDEFVKLIGLAHLDGRSIGHFKQLFSTVFDRYAYLEVNSKEFLGFYNKLLSKLFDFYSYFLTDKNEILQLQQIYWLGLDEQTQEIMWEKSSSIYYVEDKPSYEILPEPIKALLQPQFTNRDKNRFGQIGKRLGLDIKKTITQTLQPVTVLHELSVSKWFPFFAESLALIEILLEVNLDPWFDQLKTAVVKICPSITIELHSKGSSLGLVNNIPHKIMKSGRFELYVIKTSLGKKNYFYASALHDLLLEMLERDLQRVKLTLNDFFSQTYPNSFIELYEVSSDRVEEILGKLAGTIHTREQSFWIDVLNVLNIPANADYFIGSFVDYPRLAEDLGLAALQLTNLSLHYDQLDHSDNIVPLAGLFDALSITLVDYNETAAFPLDFSAYYHRKFASLRYLRKEEFRYLLHQYLASQDLEAQSRFQHLLGSYVESVESLFDRPCLILDVEAEFVRSLQAAFQELSFPAPAGWKEAEEAIDQGYRKNLRTFKNQVQPQAAEMAFYQEFLSHLEHRSLLYFDGTVEGLLAKYWALRRAEQSPVSINPEDPYNLSQYINPESLTIQLVTTVSTPPAMTNADKPRSTGVRRLDGSIPPTALAQIGLVAEKMVYDILWKRFSQVEWVSSNAAKAGFNLEGSDEHGYDLSYLGDDQVVHYVEVKGKSDDQKHFYVTYPEVHVALREKEYYHIYFVPFALDNERRQIFDLSNIFLLEDHHDMFNNTRFTATFDTLEINFK